MPRVDPSTCYREAKALVGAALEALHPLRGEDRAMVEDTMELLRKAHRDLVDALR